LAAGQELRSDSRMVGDAGLVEGHALHAIFTPHTNSYTELAPDEAGAQRSASPALLLAQQVTPISWVMGAMQLHLMPLLFSTAWLVVALIYRLSAAQVGFLFLF
jgi:hypothetical protein